MGIINILDDRLISKIAAGEVIERPASVVKELVENSIDAGAKTITVKVLDSGKRLISVSDDGSGMLPVDAKIAFERHSTSKIKDTEDLFSISTLGFRGEALASIAAVSDVTLFTNAGDAGTLVRVSGSKLLESGPYGCPKGTTIQVRDLFFNTPARKKYLKTDELSHISDIVQRYALLHPMLHIRLTADGKEIINSPATADALANFAYIYGRDAARSMLTLDRSSTISVTGFISKPELSRANRSEQTIFVNNRYVKDKVISNAINDAYHTLMMVERYPVAVINIEIPKNMIDVNVHPAKREIRLADEMKVYDAVFSAVRETLQRNDLIPERTVEHNSVLYDIAPHVMKVKERIDTAKQATLGSSDNKIELKSLPGMIIHGVANKTYILAESKDSLMIIDQHAAAERIMYERLMKQHMDRFETQALLDPELIETSPKESIILESGLDELKEYGFDIEKFGSNTFILRQVPTLLNRLADKKFIFDLLGAKKTKEDKITTMACRAAIKAGDTIGIAEIKKYMHELDKENMPFTCPHGRPVIIKLTWPELEKMFKRRI